MKTTQTVSRIALPLLALLALAGCYSVPYEQLEAKRTELRPKLALTPIFISSANQLSILLVHPM
jgi:hypothetical protein